MSAQLRQQTLSFHSTRRPEVGRPGPRSKAPTTLTPATSVALIHGARRRRKVGGINEAEAIQAFRDSCARYDAGDPDSDASLDDQPRIKQTQISYSREKKLLAITYFELTDMPRKKDKLDIPISTSLAAGNLGIDRSSLREWKKQKQRILRIKKGAKRWRGISYGRELELEFKLHS